MFHASIKTLFISVCFVASLAATGQISSTFDIDGQGWTAPNANPAIQYITTGGNPGGFVAGRPFVIILGATTLYSPFYFEAPAGYLGNQSAYYNGTLRYQIQQSTTGAPNQHAEVMLTHTSGVILYYFPPTSNQPPAAPDWATYLVPFNNESGFWRTTNSATGPAATEGQIQSVLTNLGSLSIRGLYRQANVTSRLDNVTLTRPIFINTHPAANTFACPGEGVNLVAAASGNPTISYQWQMIQGGIYTNLTNTGNYAGVTTNTLSINTSNGTATGNYRCTIAGTNVVNANTTNATVIVGTLPTPPTTTGASSCTPAALTLNAFGLTNGQYRWYDVPVGGAVLGTANSYTTPVLTLTTPYYVTIFEGSCESSRTLVLATIAPPICTNVPPVIEDAPAATSIGGQVRLNLTDLITDENGDLDLTTLTIIEQPSSGATANIDVTNGVYTLVIDYNGLTFSGTENIVIRVCDSFSACAQHRFAIAVVGEIEVFTALSPNGDGLNDNFFINHIATFDNTRKNRVTIFNRWGDAVWEGKNYDNTTVVFDGISKNGEELPSGTYYYKIEFGGGRKAENGFLSLKR